MKKILLLFAVDSGGKVEKQNPVGQLREPRHISSLRPICLGLMGFIVHVAG